MDQLQNVVADDNIPSYKRLVIEILLETTREMPELNRRSCKMLEENKKPSEENFKLMQKMKMSLRPGNVTINVSLQKAKSDLTPLLMIASVCVQLY